MGVLAHTMCFVENYIDGEIKFFSNMDYAMDFYNYDSNSDQWSEPQ